LVKENGNGSCNEWRCRRGSHHAHLDGTDLEVGHDLQGSDLILRVNKGVLVFRPRLREAVPPILEARLVRFSSG
jgi:hypothetical protein